MHGVQISEPLTCFALTLQNPANAPHASGMCKEILLCVLTHVVDEHTVAENKFVWFIGVQTGTMKSFGYHVVSKVTDRCAPAQETALVALSLYYVNGLQLFGKGAVN